MERSQDKIHKIIPATSVVSDEFTAAMNYLRSLRDTVSGQQTYSQFIEIVRKLKSNEISKSDFFRLISTIFKDCPQYLAQFNLYLPENLKIRIPTETTSLPPPIPDEKNIPQVSDFNRAVIYVQKVKEQLKFNPSLYWSFIEILHSYHKDIKNMSQNKRSILNPEDTVLRRVTSLFAGETDLINEFFELIPEVKSLGEFSCADMFSESPATSSIRAKYVEEVSPLNGVTSPVKRTCSPILRPSKVLAEVSDDDGLSTPPLDLELRGEFRVEALSDCSFFDMARTALGGQGEYDSLVRYVQLYVDGMLSYSRLFQHANVILSGMPSLLENLRHMVNKWKFKKKGSPLVSNKVHLKKDVSGYKPYGPSYRQLPFTSLATCTMYDKSQILNVTHVSFPSYEEDDTLRVKKNSYLDQLTKCEDDRIEFDYHLTSTRDCIIALKGVFDIVSIMNRPLTVKLTDSLGVLSPMLIHAVLQRVYKDTRYLSVVKSIKALPFKVIPIVVHRLEMTYDVLFSKKSGLYDDWRAVQNRTYLRSLDYQSTQFKTMDPRSLRTRSLCDEIEKYRYLLGDPTAEPHISLDYYSPRIMEDAADLLIYYIKRQNFPNEEKSHIKRLIYVFLADLLYIPRGCLSDDECSFDGPSAEYKSGYQIRPVSPKDSKSVNGERHVFYGGMHWYCFLRLHNLLCKRLSCLQDIVDQQIERNKSISADYKSQGIAEMLGFKSKGVADPNYSDVLPLIHELVDGVLDSSTFEDRLRSMFGVNSYVIFTVDKLFYHAAKNLQRIVSWDCDPADIEHSFMWLYENSSYSTNYYSAVCHFDQLYKFVFRRHPFTMQITLRPGRPVVPYLARNLRKAQKTRSVGNLEEGLRFLRMGKRYNLMKWKEHIRKQMSVEGTPEWVRTLFPL